MRVDFAFSHNFDEIRKIIIDHESSLKSISLCNLELLWQLFLYSFLEYHNIKIILLGVQVYFFDSTPKLHTIIGKLKFLKFNKIVGTARFLKDFP